MTDIILLLLLSSTVFYALEIKHQLRITILAHTSLLLILFTLLLFTSNDPNIVANLNLLCGEEICSEIRYALFATRSYYFFGASTYLIIICTTLFLSLLAAAFIIFHIVKQVTKLIQEEKEKQEYPDLPLTKHLYGITTVRFGLKNRIHLRLCRWLD